MISDDITGLKTFLVLADTNRNQELVCFCILRSLNCKHALRASISHTVRFNDDGKNRYDKIILILSINNCFRITNQTFRQIHIITCKKPGIRSTTTGTHSKSVIL
ncbi:hypothetical protein LOAG_09603 [Loa loa]|uniref:Uncharacterized protein n=1 Tax=Loa loa TaxID=7209 RepID=A0A1S0TS48_LOALO|nr:hypothetical protein LOAG_09603 [Loa loa]EFO18891.1 hypothetical protein LOAG_09603 [Loa loa]